jgi:RNA polymerase subunit RPABC4/transcription elongation factor Spt4
MFCTQCGTQLVPHAKFCSNCGLPTSGEPLSVGAAAPKTSAVAPAHVTDPVGLGTKWLKFWNYFSLPVGGVIGLLMSFGMPALGIIMVPLAVLQFVVAYGLHYRKLWAWQWNWILVVITYIGMLIPTPTPGSHAGTADLMMQFVIKLILGSLIWMWPNYAYWRKRRLLFSTEPTPETHVRCPDCRRLIPNETRVCEFCGCKLVPQP